MPLLSILSLASVERGVVCVDDDDPISASIPVSVNFILPNFNSGQVLYVFETLESLLGIGEGLFLDPLCFDVDLLLLLFSLEKLLVFCFEVAADVEDSPSKWEQSLSEYTRLILRDGEFVEAPVVKSDSLDLLQESVAILYAVYSCFLDSSDISLSPIKDRIEYRMKKLFGIDLLEFLEWYYSHYADPATVVDTWSLLTGYLRETFPFNQSLKLSFLSQLRIGITAFNKISKLDIYRDKKFRKEAEETFLKLCDYSIQSFGVSFEQSLWKVATEEADKQNSVLAQDQMMLKIWNFFAETIPKLRSYIFDNDKSTLLLANIMYYIVSPALKSKKRYTR
ncbi:MAG: hypothetical protein SGCHY_001709 [Lobulomycetales sp.]